ncbi:transcription factor bHLH [Quillaja saponaria]|uniref:Transcription factor bHLH n=1 Tax=Quillaja saponaria TaxID=32244 RepID=A0AAD7L963_QUISA|nr:transcription factor bHLH [Quillaja saponaria]
MVSLRQLEQGMQQVRSYYKSESYTMRNSFPQVRSSSDAYRNSFSKPRSKAEVKLLAAKKHSESEKRRRMRINSQYATLRAILPNLVKMDKASVLEETIRQVMALKKNVSELEAVSRGSTDEIVFPGESDKLNLEHCIDDQGLMKATLSCEDRPGLMSALARALRSVKGKVVRAEMVTVGGRTKSVLWVQGLGCGNEGMGMLKRALKVVIHRP